MSDKRKATKPLAIDVPHVPPAEVGPRDAESRAVASHPAFRRLIAEGRDSFARGEGIDAEDVFRDLGLSDQNEPNDASRKTHNGARTNGQSVKERMERTPEDAKGWRVPARGKRPPRRSAVSVTVAFDPDQSEWLSQEADRTGQDYDEIVKRLVDARRTDSTDSTNGSGRSDKR